MLWRVGDLLVWDHRCTMHRAHPLDDRRHPRDMRHITAIDGSAPTPPASPARAVPAAP